MMNKNKLKSNFLRIITSSAEEFINVFISGFTGAIVAIGLSNNQYWLAVFYTVVMVIVGVAAKSVIKFVRCSYES